MTVLVTHDPLDALTLADHLVFVRDGAVVQSGAPREIVRRPRDPYVAQVAGLNLYAAQADSGGVCRLASGRVIVSSDPTEVGDCWVSFAPSAVALHRHDPEGSARNVWTGTVSGIELTGQIARVSVRGPVDLVADITLAALTSLALVPGVTLHASVKATEGRAYPR